MELLMTYSIKEVIQKSKARVSVRNMALLLRNKARVKVNMRGFA